MEDPDAAVRERAAAAWCAWEDAVLSNEDFGPVDVYEGRPLEARLAFVRICSHYFANRAWLEKDQIAGHIDLVADIPAVLVHGRQDMSAPPRTAWNLARHWPAAGLHLLHDAGHKGNDEMQRILTASFDAFAVAGPRNGAPSAG